MICQNEELVRQNSQLFDIFGNSNFQADSPAGLRDLMSTIDLGSEEVKTYQDKNSKVLQEIVEGLLRDSGEAERPILSGSKVCLFGDPKVVQKNHLELIVELQLHEARIYYDLDTERLDYIVSLEYSPE